MTPQQDLLATLALVLFILGFIVFLIWSFFDYAKRVEKKRKREYEAYQTGLDNSLRVTDHTEEYVQKDRKIRTLKAQRRDAKIGYYAAWIGGIICLFVFPPIGIPLTGFAIIMSIREGRKLRKEMRDKAYEIKDVRESMPEK